LLAADIDGVLVDRMNETIDGEWQKYTVESGTYSREKFFGTDPRLAKLVEHLSDEQIRKLRLGGHDPAKVYAAYKAAVEHRERPTVILARTIKGYGMGEAGEGRNVTHQQKKLNYEELRTFRDRFAIPIADKDLEEAPFYRPPADSDEYKYLLERRQERGGVVPRRRVRAAPLKAPKRDMFKEFLQSSGDREAATTMALVRMLTRLMDDPELGKLIVPIVPDEARTFGMDALFRKYGIYSHVGQTYEPVDSHLLLYYRESKDGQILEEGITEAGSMASFTAAGTANVTHGLNMIPFFLFYSMFGFQRIGDSAWAAADSRTRGFLIGCTAGRTTLAGEGLQHQDGHSHLLASTIPNLVSYDPAFAYEIAIIVQDGIRRMYEDGEPVYYYITVQNEPYVQPAMPEGVEEGILKGIYKYRAAGERHGGTKGRRHEGPESGPESGPERARVHLFGSGSIIREALKAQEVLADQFNVAADVWSVTSYNLLRRDALACERWNLLNPDASPRVPYIAQVLADEPHPTHTPALTPVIATSDYMKAVPDQIARWVPGGMHPLGTDGFGRSEARAQLRDCFEIDHKYVTLAALQRLAAIEGGQDGDAGFPANKLKAAAESLGIDAAKINPLDAPTRRQS